MLSTRFFFLLASPVLISLVVVIVLALKLVLALAGVLGAVSGDALCGGDVGEPRAAPSRA